MTVIFIAVIVLLISIPVVSAMRRDMAVSSAINTVSVASAAARALSTKKVVVGSFDIDPTAPGVQYTQVPPGGAAAVFTQTGAVRMVEYNESANDSVGSSQADSGPFGTFPGTPPVRSAAFGFVDKEDFDTIQMPDNAGVFGIYRGEFDGNTGNGDELALLAPPFAIRFDYGGNLVTQGAPPPDFSEAAGYVFYPFDNDAQYDRQSTRLDVETNFVGATDGYNDAGNTPATYQLGGANYAVDANGVPYLPFCRLEPVVGVVVCDGRALDQFLAATNGSIPGYIVVPDSGAFDDLLAANTQAILSDGTFTADEKLAAWLLSRNVNDSQMLMINRYTGNVIKEYELQ